MDLDVLIFLCGDDKPCHELSDHGGDGLVLVVDVVFGELVNILCVDLTDDGLNADLVDDLLKCVVLPFQLLVVLELQELPASGCIRDGRIDAGREEQARAVEVGVVGDELHLVGGEDKREVR